MIAEDDREPFVRRIDHLIDVSDFTQDQRNRAVAFAIAGEVLRERATMGGIGEARFGETAAGMDQIMGVSVEDESDEFSQEFKKSHRVDDPKVQELIDTLLELIEKLVVSSDPRVKEDTSLWLDDRPIFDEDPRDPILG